MMEKCTNVLKQNSAPAVYQIAGEPAVAISGVPDVTIDCSSPSKLGSMKDFDLNEDPLFGEWMEGRDVRKMFGDQYYSGKVSNYDREMNWYRVVYEDGDFEDLYWHELEEVLVPLDISIPLKEVATDILKHRKSAEETADKPRKDHKRNANSAQKMGNSRRMASSTKSKGHAEDNGNHE